jgi:uncharacterized cupredoxin-like copper-binding protein
MIKKRISVILLAMILLSNKSVIFASTQKERLEKQNVQTKAEIADYTKSIQINKKNFDDAQVDLV